MTVVIKRVKEGLIQINGKSVFKDMEDNWCTHQELTSAEGEAFIEFKKTIENPKEE